MIRCHLEEEEATKKVKKKPLNRGLVRLSGLNCFPGSFGLNVISCRSVVVNNDWNQVL